MIIFQKMQHFQTFLIPSDRFQIRYGIVQKKANDHLNPNPENEKNMFKSLIVSAIFRVMVHFLAVFENMKIRIFFDIFL